MFRASPGTSDSSFKMIANRSQVWWHWWQQWDRKTTRRSTGESQQHELRIISPGARHPVASPIRGLPAGSPVPSTACDNSCIAQNACWDEPCSSAFEGRPARTGLRCSHHEGMAVQRSWKHSSPHENCKIEAEGAWPLCFIRPTEDASSTLTEKNGPGSGPRLPHPRRRASRTLAARRLLASGEKSCTS